LIVSSYLATGLGELPATHRAANQRHRLVTGFRGVLIFAQRCVAMTQADVRLAHFARALLY